MLLLVFVLDIIFVSGLTQKQRLLNLTCRHLTCVLKDIRALYNTRKAILFEKGTENLGMPPLPTLQRAKCAEWMFGRSRWGLVVVGGCLTGCLYMPA